MVRLLPTYPESSLYLSLLHPVMRSFPYNATKVLYSSHFTGIPSPIHSFTHSCFLSSFFPHFASSFFSFILSSSFLYSFLCFLSSLSPISLALFLLSILSSSFFYSFLCFLSFFFPYFASSFSPLSSPLHSFTIPMLYVILFPHFASSFSSSPSSPTSIAPY